jgi:hypothetical protein
MKIKVEPVSHDADKGAHLIGRWNFVELPVISDPRGKLTFLEANRHVDFDIKRIYYLFDIPADAERGGHAHIRLQQLVIPLSGSFDVLCDNGARRETITLNRPFRGLLIKNLVWRELMNFTSGAVCLVIASEPYDESDYFRNYADFQAHVAQCDFG